MTRRGLVRLDSFRKPQTNKQVSHMMTGMEMALEGQVEKTTAATGACEAANDSYFGACVA